MINTIRVPFLAFIFCSFFLLSSCTKEGSSSSTSAAQTTAAITAAFGANINLNALPNYAAQTIPAYITKDNGMANVITNGKAVIGRVLFYDKKLSTTNTISCASCHLQQFAFSDTAAASVGVNGTTGRHAMRLVNARFANEPRFFWDERAATLELQTTRPIQDHAEMGYSGADGDPALSVLLTKLQGVEYYKELFTAVYGDAAVTEARMQECLAQFVRSIQSFDAKYDAGRAAAGNDQAPFANFSPLENQGKNLFFAPPQFDGGGNRIGGGAGCAGCHAGPEFDIDPRSLNNGVIGKIGGGTDVTVTRAPSLRDVVKSDGTANGPFMHIGASSQLITVINHYDSIVVSGNTNLDPRLRPAGNPQRLRLTQVEKDALTAFIRTLAGTNVYTDTKWSDPFVK